MIPLSEDALRAEFERIMGGVDDDLQAAELRGASTWVHDRCMIAANLSAERLLAQRCGWPILRWLEALIRCTRLRARLRLLLAGTPPNKARLMCDPLRPYAEELAAAQESATRAEGGNER